MQCEVQEYDAFAAPFPGLVGLRLANLCYINPINNNDDATHDQDPMYKWGMVDVHKTSSLTVLLQFQRTTREGNWFLYLAALEKLCVYFAYNWVDYIYATSFVK